MPLVRITIAKVSSLDLWAIMLGGASIAENIGFEGVKYASHSKAERRNYYYSNLSIK